MNSAATRVERTALLHFNLGIEEGEEKSARYSKESFRPSTISRQQNSLESYLFRIFLWRNTKQEALLSGHRNRISIESIPEISKSLAGSRYNFCSRIFILHDNLLIHPFKLPTPFFLASWKETILPYTLSYPLIPSLTPLYPLTPLHFFVLNQEGMRERFELVNRKDSIIGEWYFFFFNSWIRRETMPRIGFSPLIVVNLPPPLRGRFREVEISS